MNFTSQETTGVLMALAAISTDDAAQIRVKIRAAVVRDYAVAMKAQLAAGDLRFPPVILFSDGKYYWLADGVHRILAARQIGLSEIAVEVRPGTHRDALLFAVSANSAHGLPRSRADQRKAVALLLADEEWRQWSDREIAKRCQVSNNMVSRMRRGASVLEAQMRPRKAKRDGVIYEMSVANKVTPIPTTDALGLPLPHSRADAFARLNDFQEAIRLFDRLSGILDRIAQGPAGVVYRRDMYRAHENGQVRFVCPALRISRNNLLAAEPYCAYCPVCHPKNSERPHPDCPQCGGRGWTARAAFASCGAVERQKILAMKSGQPEARSAS